MNADGRGFRKRHDEIEFMNQRVSGFSHWRLRRNQKTISRQRSTDLETIMNQIAVSDPRRSAHIRG
jgi:hypothetical protein